MVQRTTPSLQAWFCLQEIHRTTKTGIAFVPGDWAPLCYENDLCLKPTEEKQDKILYHLPQLVSRELLKNWRPSLPYWKSYSQPLQKQRIRSWCLQNRAPHCHSYRGKLCLVFPTRSPQYWPHLWFSRSALVCPSRSACFWTHVISHGRLTLFNSSLQHLCAMIKDYPKE